MFVQKFADALVLETFAFHHVTPMACGITNAQKNRLVFTTRFFKRFAVPCKPVNRIVCMLQKIGRFFLRETICKFHPAKIRANIPCAKETLTFAMTRDKLAAMSKKLWQPELVLLFCGTQFICFSLGMLVAGLLHKFNVNGFRHEEDFGNVLLATISFQGATWVLIPIFLRLHQMRWRDVFGSQSLLRSFGWALATLIVVLPIALLLQNLSAMALEKIGWQPKAQAAVELLKNAPLWPTGMYLGFFAVVLAPVAEEFIFRGVLFPFFKQLGFPKMAWIGVSLLFALVHGAATIFIPLFVLALALTWLYEKTDSLLAPIVVHSLFNAANLIGFYFAQKSGAL
jgi:membrane protease YdiL (CAAX protease family)